MVKHRVFATIAGLVGAAVLVCGAVLVMGSPTGGPPAGAQRGPVSVSVSASSGAQARPRTDARIPLGTTDRATPASDDAWTGTWATAPAGAEPGVPHGYPGRTIRNVVHTSIGGSGARITLSNLFSPQALLVGRASIAVAADRDGGIAGKSGARAIPGTVRELTFAHRRSVYVPAGGHLVSDPVRLTVPAGSDLLVSLYTPRRGGPVTYHPYSLQTSYLALGDHTEDSGAAAYRRSATVWRYLTAVDVLNQRTRGAVVAFGDSITDGVGSSVDANRRWPDILAGRLGNARYGVLNEGIGGNRILQDAYDVGSGPSGLSRFDSDVLDRAGARVVIIDLGINDILRDDERDPGKITAGLKDLTRLAHAHGLRVVGSTLAPYGGFHDYTASGEAVREQVNAEIRAGGVFDQVVDFDRILRDPAAPNLLRPAYDSGDGLHPNDAGYRAMADALDLRALEGRAATRT
jgi:lysophospholipase L1-like esterase